MAGCISASQKSTDFRRLDEIFHIFLKGEKNRKNRQNNLT